MLIRWLKYSLLEGNKLKLIFTGNEGSFQDKEGANSDKKFPLPLLSAYWCLCDCWAESADWCGPSVLRVPMVEDNNWIDCKRFWDIDKAHIHYQLWLRKHLHTHVHERDFCFKRMSTFMNFALSLGTTRRMHVNLHSRQWENFEMEAFYLDNPGAYPSGGGGEFGACTPPWA